MTNINEVILDGNARIYSRENTKNLFLYIPVKNGTPKRFSLGTDIISEAKKIALDKYLAYKEGTLKVKSHKRQQDERKFIEYAYKAREFYLAQGSKLNAGIIDNHLVPFFGDMFFEEITDDTISVYDRFLAEKLGNPPSKSLVNTHNVILRKIFKYAVAARVAVERDLPLLTVKNRGLEGTRRPTFTEEQMQMIVTHLPGYYVGGKDYAARFKRKLLVYYVAVLKETGMRPGKEIDSLRWKHIIFDWYNERDGGTYTRINMPHRKTAKKDKNSIVAHVIAPQSLKKTLMDLQNETRRCDPEDLLFCHHDGAPARYFGKIFAKYLRSIGITHDIIGRNYCLYSIRHYYATMLDDSGIVPRQFIAKQMGTSVEMLDDFYAHVDIDKHAGTISAIVTGSTPEEIADVVRQNRENKEKELIERGSANITAELLKNLHKKSEP